MTDGRATRLARVDPLLPSWWDRGGMASAPRSLPAAEDPIDGVVDVETPEHVRFRYRTAGPARRALAYLIDFLIRYGALFCLAMAIAIAHGMINLGDAPEGAVLLVLFLVEWCYYVMWEWLWNGSTPGKRAMSLRVVKEDGHGIQFTDALLRNLLRAADFLPMAYTLGLIAMCTDRRFRRLGDRVAGTMVIVEQRERVATPLRIEPPLQEHELAALPLHLHLPAEEMEALDALLRRSGSLAPARELELAEMAAPVLISRFAVTGMSPMRVVAAVYARATAGHAPQLKAGRPR